MINTKPRLVKQNDKELIMINLDIKYQDDKDLIRKFLMFYKENDELKYLNQIVNSTEIEIDMADLLEYLNSNNSNSESSTLLYSNILENCYTYLKMTYGVIDDVKFAEETPLDPFIMHRISRFKEKFPEGSVSDTLGFLLRNYTIKIKCSNLEMKTVRELNSSTLGSLVKVSGIVTKCTQVKPSVKVATYICEACGTETYQQVNNNDVFDLLEECNSDKCKKTKIRGALCLVSRGSKFTKYQNLQIQESNESVPVGSIPRSLNVDCYGSDTEKVRPGEKVVLYGIHMPRAYYGYKKLKAGLLNDSYMLCTSVQESTYVENPSQTSHSDLVSLFAPEIYGMEDVKKLLLLSLIGSPTLTKDDGMKIRGEINILLVGDPGIAKSQLLKTATRVSRRGVYTTGKASSAAGLTASVSRDPVTNEWILEGGALVLADNGMCCIDEFDKMNDIDRVSIHEVMEQQTVTISKAGINTTLNARCSVLAAANPIRGRYDTKKSVEHNINLPVSLMSRFDVIAVLRDTSDSNRDMALADFVTKLHRPTEEDETEESDSYDTLRAEIDKRRALNVTISESLRNEICEIYINKRKNSRTMTPRYILSLIRLSQANARYNHISTGVSSTDEVIDVTLNDVNEAIRLLEMYSVEKTAASKVSQKSVIYGALINAQEEKRVDLVQFYQSSGFKKEKIDAVIAEFAEIGIWMVEEEGYLTIYE